MDRSSHTAAVVVVVVVPLLLVRITRWQASCCWDDAERDASVGCSRQRQQQQQ